MGFEVEFGTVYRTPARLDPGDPRDLWESGGIYMDLHGAEVIARAYSLLSYISRIELFEVFMGLGFSISTF